MGPLSSPYSIVLFTCPFPLDFSSFSLSLLYSSGLGFPPSSPLSRVVPEGDHSFLPRQAYPYLAKSKEKVG